MKRIPIPENLPDSSSGEYFFVDIPERQGFYSPQQYQDLVRGVMAILDKPYRISVLSGNTRQFLRVGNFLYKDNSRLRKRLVLEQIAKDLEQKFGIIIQKNSPARI